MALSKREMAQIDKIREKLSFAIWDMMSDMDFNTDMSKTEIKRTTLRDCKINIKDYPSWKSK